MSKLNHHPQQAVGGEAVTSELPARSHCAASLEQCRVFAASQPVQGPMRYFLNLQDLLPGEVMSFSRFRESFAVQIKELVDRKLTDCLAILQPPHLSSNME